MEGAVTISTNIDGIVPSKSCSADSSRTRRLRPEKSLLLVGNFFSTAKGSRTVCADLAAKLQESKWSVIVTSRYRNKILRLLDMTSTVWLKKHSFNLAQVDVYSGPAFVWAELTCELLRHLGKPYLLTLHGGNLPAFAQRWPGRVRRLLRGAFAVTTPSHYLMDAMKSYRTDLSLLPNAIELDKYAFRCRGRIRPSLVWLRAFHKIYNPSLVPHVMACLRCEFPDLHLTMVGPDTQDGTLQLTVKLADDLSVSQHLRMLGPIPKANVPECLAEADIFLNTADIDNAPVTIVEAMACGLCIISTSVGGIPYLLRDGHDALLVPPNDPEAMAAAVRRILKEPGLAKILSRNARRKAEEFSWSNILPQWEELLLNAGNRDA